MPRLVPVLVLLAACGPSEPVTVTTYNAGLAPGFVDGSASRTPLVASAIAGLDADVVCLQEVWTPDDVAAIQAATAEAFPHQLWPEGTQSILEEPGCTTDETDRLLGCVADNCGEVCDEYLDDCMLDNCAIRFINVAETCQGCVMANVGGDVEQVREVCEAGYPEYAYDGAYGTAVLSRHPVRESAHIPMDATTNRRGVHHAVIDGPAGRMDVYCTHLTAVFSLLPYPREEGDWDEEQRAQIARLGEIIDETAQTDRVVLLGDFNTGPDLGEDIVAEQPLSWDRLSPGWSIPYVEDGGACTWCPDNPLIGGGEGHILDHVLVRGFESATSRRDLDGGADIQVCDEDTSAALSDHYAVTATLTP